MNAGELSTLLVWAAGLTYTIALVAYTTVLARIAEARPRAAKVAAAGATAPVAASVAAGHKILSMDPLPDAVYCTNNFMTIGMMRAIHATGLQCPRDIAVAAFDDFPWTESFRPQLTAMAQPAFGMGEDAVRLLLDRMSKRRVGRAVRLTLSTEFFIRESCGARLKAHRRPKAP